MSYRAFKHLLGETSLERKCRFLFGAGILLLLTACFWWYAHRTEKPIYDQYTITCRFLANKTLTDEYLKRQLKPPEWQRIEELSKANMPKTLLSYSSDIIIPNTAHRLDPNEKDLLKEFQNDPDMNEHWQTREPKGGEESGSIYYYAAIRASKEGLTGLPLTPEEREAYSNIKEKDLLAMVKVIATTKSIEESIIWNRAVLISTALVAALLI